MNELTIYERMEIQMSYAVPLLRDLQAVLGTDVVLDALRQRLIMQQERARSRARQPGAIEEQAVKIGRDFERFATGGALEFSFVDSDAEEVAVDVTDCRYATMMAGLDATDFGPLLICGGDYAAAAAGGMELQRTQTRMEGASHCDFRFHVSRLG